MDIAYIGNFNMELKETTIAPTIDINKIRENFNSAKEWLVDVRYAYKFEELKSEDKKFVIWIVSRDLVATVLGVFIQQGESMVMIDFLKSILDSSSDSRNIYIELYEEDF